MQKSNSEQLEAFRAIVNKQKIAIFALVITLLGVVFIFAHGLPPEFKDLGIALIPSGIITALNEFLLRSDFLRDLKEIQRGHALSEKLESLRIIDIYEKRAAAERDPIFGYIALMAKDAPEKMKKISILGISIEPFMNLVGDKNMESLLKAGCNFQFLSLDANSDVARRRNNEQGQPGLLERIRSFDAWIQTYVTQPILGLTWEFPVIEVGKGSELFDKYKKQFEEVWKKAYSPNQTAISVSKVPDERAPAASKNNKAT
jgi:hypothetical protein